MKKPIYCAFPFAINLFTGKLTKIKTLISIALAIFAISQAGAATAYSVQNNILGFSVIFIPASDSDGTDLMACNEDDKCIGFVLVRAEKNKELAGLCREKNKKCDLVVSEFEKNLGTRNTKDEGMLRLSAVVVRAIVGTDNCQLPQSGLKKLRALTGIYTD